MNCFSNCAFLLVQKEVNVLILISSKLPQSGKSHIPNRGLVGVKYYEWLTKSFGCASFSPNPLFLTSFFAASGKKIATYGQAAAASAPSSAAAKAKADKAVKKVPPGTAKKEEKSSNDKVRESYPFAWCFSLFSLFWDPF